ncbi:unnamed protein product [Gongylonema pulchrum]|uniref:Adaptin_N domain-containing protein n=1 Tax=Gongylonema pulchrum TaxID=637853 RepID=A0A183DTJ9_9BILA|nr:unnamed protein product [Gongylonema pulchrum]
MDTSLLSTVVRAINHSSSDVKCVAALAVHHISARKLTVNEMKGAPREVLVDAYQTLQKALKETDLGLEPLSNIPNVP